MEKNCRLNSGEAIMGIVFYPCFFFYLYKIIKSTCLQYNVSSIDKLTYKCSCFVSAALTSTRRWILRQVPINVTTFSPRACVTQETSRLLWTFETTRSSTTVFPIRTLDIRLLACNLPIRNQFHFILI